MKEFTLLMAFVDFVPVLLFLFACINIKRIIETKVDKRYLYVFAFGCALIITAGMFKANYKLFYALNIGDFEWMSSQFFSNQAFGFLIAGFALFLGVRKNTKIVSALPTMALVGMMVIGLCAMDASLCYLASKAKKKNALICFIISFFCSLAMGYLSSKDFTKAFMNWVAQGINIVGQLLLYVGTKSLREV